MASLQEMYSGSMLTRVSISAQALPQSNRTLPPPAPQRAELHPGVGLEELHSQAACTVKKTGGLHSQCSPTCTHPARSLPSSLSSGRELELHGILTDTQNAGPQSLSESSRAVAISAQASERNRTGFQNPAPQFTTHRGQVSLAGIPQKLLLRQGLKCK